MKPSYLTKYISFATVALALILVLLPFHAFLTVWGASLTGQYDMLRVWKEVLLVLLVPVAGLIVWKTPPLWQRLRTGWLFWCIVFYVLLHVALGVLALAKNQVNSYAFVFALIVNLRFLLIFLIAYIVATQSSWLRDHWRQLLLGPAVVVVVFGLLQTFVLPLNFLSNFGYSPETIAPYETVDEKLDYVRIQSTLRGANPLGAYLILVVGALVVLLARRKASPKLRVYGIAFLVASLVVALATFSRSAYIGIVAAAAVAVWLVARNAIAKKWFVVVLVGATLLAGSLFVLLRDNDRFENTFFHTDEHSTSLSSSNASRLTAMIWGAEDAISEPFGRGPGTAGPASAHNVQSARIAENYYLQIAQEVGWLGLGLFAAVNALVARELWRKRTGALARTLLVGLVGITLVNLLSHAWTDDTLALVWWALAGIVTAPGILIEKKASAHGQKIQKEKSQNSRTKTPGIAPA